MTQPSDNTFVGIPVSQSPEIRLPDPDALYKATHDIAATLFAQVGHDYLQFRRISYEETTPSLATLPPESHAIQQAEIALLADNALRFVTPALKSIPLIGGLVEHLQRVANIHSISQQERTALHNEAMLFLHGIKGGIHGWYVEWMYQAAASVSRVVRHDYFIYHPWDALLYMNDTQLAEFGEAIRSQNTDTITRYVSQLASSLRDALLDPVATQPKLAFTGPDHEEIEAQFNLKTTAALALGALLIAGEVQVLLHHHDTQTPPPSAIPPFPEVMKDYITKVHNS